MPGVTDVINIALRRIGATPITSLTDGSDSANAADDIYTEVRDDLLRSNPWNFATKRVKLAQSSVAPVFEFDFAYPLPSDWLRTVSIHDNDASHGTILFRMEDNNGQNSIITSSSEIWMRYIYRETNPDKWSTDFRTAVEYSIAQALSIVLTSSNTLEETMSKHATRTLARARSSDGMGSFPELRPRGSWASSRGGRRRNDFLSD